MTWEEILKASSEDLAEDLYERIFTELKEQYEETIAHPNFREESIYSFSKNKLSRRAADARVFFDSFIDYSPHFFTFYEEIADGADFTSDYFKKFIAEHARVRQTLNNQFTNRGVNISEDAYYYELQSAARTFTVGFVLAFENAAQKRSMAFLEDNAKIFGVDADVIYSHKGRPARVEFSHDGLNFSMAPERLTIHLPRLPRDAKIKVCVYNADTLPIGDYYTQLLGLVVARPDELDVVGFAIDLAKILLDVEMDFYFEKWPKLDLGVFTPFEASNDDENDEFKRLMDLLKEHGTYKGRPHLADTRGYALQQILDALEKHFGSYMGWFE